MLAEALQVLVPMEKLQPHLDKFDAEFGRAYLAKMRKKVFMIQCLQTVLYVLKFVGEWNSIAKFCNKFKCHTEKALSSKMKIL